MALLFSSLALSGGLGRDVGRTATTAGRPPASSLHTRGTSRHGAGYFGAGKDLAWRRSRPVLGADAPRRGPEGVRAGRAGEPRRPDGQQLGPKEAALASASTASLRRITSDLPPTIGVCTHGPTGAQVFVIGCLHGSPQSAGDVTRLIQEVAPGAVVLELCPRRWKSLSRRAHTETPEGRKAAGAVVFKWWRGVRRAYVRRGLSHAVAAASISSLYLVQELVSGYDPGAEFKAAIMAMARLPEHPEVVLGDRDVQSTVGDLTDVRSLLGGLLSLAEIRRSAAVASRIVQGGPLPSSSLQARTASDPSSLSDHPKVSIPAAISYLGVDLARTLLPFCLLGWGVANLAVGAVHSGDSSASATGSLPAGFLSAAVEGTLLVTVPLLWLRLCDTIVTERDILLAESIMQACDEGHGAPVVAVLGLFHCNAVLAKVSSGDPTV